MSTSVDDYSPTLGFRFVERIITVPHESMPDCTRTVKARILQQYFQFITIAGYLVDSKWVDVPVVTIEDQIYGHKG
jgi:hypothetical protein